MSLDEICEEYKENLVKKIEENKNKEHEKDEQNKRVLNTMVEDLDRDLIKFKTNDIVILNKDGYKFTIFTFADSISVHKCRIPVTEQEKFLFKKRHEIFKVDKELYEKFEKEMEMENFTMFLFKRFNEGVTEETLNNGIKEAKEQLEKWLK